MNLKRIFSFVIAAMQLGGMAAQETKTIQVERAGTLIEHFTLDEADQVKHLIVQGKINATDFVHLRDEFRHLTTLDLSQATINLYAGKQGTAKGFYVYPGNCIPAYAFCREVNDSTFEGKTSLQTIVLSDKIRNIEDAAFKGCNNLRACQINRAQAPNLLKAALADSITAVFVPASAMSNYRHKQNWEPFAIIEGKPVSVTVQIAQMGSLASELLRQGIQPKEVNFLTVEGKTDVADFVLIRDYMPNLVSVDLSRSIATFIPDYTFTQKKNLLRVVLPHALQRIGQRVFSGCSRLSGTLTLPATVTSIGFGAFMECERLRSVEATGKITALGDKLFGEEKSRLKFIP